MVVLLKPNVYCILESSKVTAVCGPDRGITVISFAVYPAAEDRRVNSCPSISPLKMAS
jgi:hypothetical protein